MTVFLIYGCPACHTRWWTHDQEISEGHHCPAGYPAGGLLIARLEQPDPPQPSLKEAA